MKKISLCLVLILTLVVPSLVLATTSSQPKVYSKGTNTLTLQGEFIADGEDGAILVKDGAQLTINGTETTKVHANLGAGNYSMAVWAKEEGTKITINGGYYTNETDGSNRGTDLIYASNGAQIEITGGTFKAAKTEWTLNCKDNTTSRITVKGGTFYKFDPSNNKVGEGEIVIPEGYEVIKNGDWYTVKAKETKVSTTISNNVDDSKKVEEILKETLANNEELAEIIQGKDVEIKVEIKSTEASETEKEKIESEVSKQDSNLKVTNYIEITITVKDTEEGKTLGNLETVEKTITFTVSVPEDLPEVAEGFERVYYIVRNHNGKIELLPATVVNGKIQFESDKFSTYAIAYKDVKKDNTKDKSNSDIDNNIDNTKTENNDSKDDTIPKTGDSIIYYVIIAVVSIVCLIVTIKIRKDK